MQPLPKIVSARLQAAPRSEHPDADVLTAFAEQSLLHSERTLVMEHLSHCGGCREVLALALPEMEEAAAPAVVRRAWFNLASLGMPSLNMPMLRWGAIAAAVLVVGSIGVIRYRQNAPENTVASLKLAPEARPRTANESAIPSTEARTEATPAMSVASKPSPMIAPSASGDSIARAAVSGRNETGLHASTSAPMAQGGPVLGRPFATSLGSASKSLPEVATTAPTLAQQSPVDAQQNQLSHQSESQTDQLSADQSLSDQSSSAPSEGRAIIAKAKAPVTSQTGAVLAGSSSAVVQISPAAPRWTITTAGGLQRSYDQGKTWQDVNVPVVSQAAATALQIDATAPATQTVSRLKQQKDSIASPVFRTISVSGAEVWAGAAGGVLYHSVDSGDHWFSAIPSYNGILLTGDIISVQFADSLHGKLATSTSETWTTGDGGQHWSKQ